jgi:hypothetical protein
MIEWVATDTVSEYEFPCRKCNGTGEITLTNEEYLCTCSTEERAKFLTEVILSDRRFRMTMVGGVEETKAWLKEEHNER